MKKWVIDECDTTDAVPSYAYIDFHCPVCESGFVLEEGQYGWCLGDEIPYRYCPVCGERLYTYQRPEEAKNPVALENVVDLERQTRENNKAMNKVLDFIVDGGKDLHTIADHYGLRLQMQKTVEETGEMLAELGRLMLDGENRAIRLALLEEMADVEIMLDQLKYLLDCEKFCEETRRWKIKRQLDRIREEKAKKDE